MNKAILALPLILAVAAPAQATGGLLCRTAGADPIEVSLVIGHMIGSPLVSARMLDNGLTVPVSEAQWWLDPSEVRLVLTDPDARRKELVLRAKRNGQVYDGSLWRNGNQRWVRCREG